MNKLGTRLNAIEKNNSATGHGRRAALKSPSRFRNVETGKPDGGCYGENERKTPHQQMGQIAGMVKNGPIPLQGNLTEKSGIKNNPGNNSEREHIGKGIQILADRDFPF